MRDVQYEEISRSRTAVGRAYYAAFLQTKKKLEELGCSFSWHSLDMYGIHKQVIEMLLIKNSSMGNYLETLRKYRIESDYDMNIDINKDIAKTCIKISRTILNKLINLQ